MILWLIRHPRTVLPDGICYGRSDIELDPRFVEEVADMVERVLQDAPGSIYISPLKRCRMLAELIGDPRIDGRLRELDFGRWEMRRWSEIDRLELVQWRDHPLEWKIPGGESVADLARRCGTFLADIEAARPAKACVVAHGGVIRVLGCFLWRQDVRCALDFHVPLGSALRVECKAGVARLLDRVGFQEARFPAWAQ